MHSSISLSFRTPLPSFLHIPPSILVLSPTYTDTINSLLIMSGIEQAPISEPVAVSATGNDNSQKSPGPEVAAFVNHQSGPDSELEMQTSDSDAPETIAAKVAFKKRQKLFEESEFGPEVKQIIADKRSWGGWHTTASDPVSFSFFSLVHIWQLCEFNLTYSMR
jgi:hypothetical protein